MFSKKKKDLMKEKLGRDRTIFGCGFSIRVIHAQEEFIVAPFVSYMPLVPSFLYIHNFKQKS